MKNLFPKWVNTVPIKLFISIGLLGCGIVAGITYYATPKYTRVGYQPTQPVPYDHSFHAGQLGLDCRYCHHGVEKSSHANIPSANVCMSCHKNVKANSPLLEVVRQSYYGEDKDRDGQLSEDEDLNGDGVITAGLSVPWVRIHKAPDYVYFNHAIHVNRGISCVECHGRIDQMEVVHHAKHLSMSFCLECHRNPEKALRPNSEVTNLAWSIVSGSHSGSQSEADLEQIHAGLEIKENWGINPPLSCTGCHR
jgi:hypothetical protein